MSLPKLNTALNAISSAIFLLALSSVLYRFHFTGKIPHIDAAELELSYFDPDEFTDRLDTRKCSATLTEGRWLGVPTLDMIQEPVNRVWQPPGCMLHEYKAKDVQHCLQHKDVIFIGDSTVRQLFWATARLLNEQKAYEAQHMAVKHANLHFEQDKAALLFVWDPWLNSSLLHRQEVNHTSLTNGSLMKSTSALTVFGGGLWHAQHLGSTALTTYTETLQAINQSLGNRPKSDHFPLATIILPIRTPEYSSLSTSHAERMTLPLLEDMNRNLRRYSQSGAFVVPWAFEQMLRDFPEAFQADGLHVHDTIASKMAQILANVKCNDETNTRINYPMDKTCCGKYPGLISSQYCVFVAASVAISLCSPIKRLRRATEPAASTLQYIATLLLICIYCHLTDRTQVWDKMQKRFSYKDFTSLSLLAAFLGILSIRKSRRSKGRKDQSEPGHDNTPAFSREQSDEMKGWMQCMILFYHYTGASKILMIYQGVRILVAAYLWMTGFGHTLFYLRKGDFSLKRTASVLIRLNLLSVLLSYFMATDYLFYYFAPLTSFWFCIVWVTMFTGHRRNENLTIVAGKVLISCIMSQYVLRYTRCLEMILVLLRKTCNINWNAHEWRFRLQLDSNIVFVGMLSAVIFHQHQLSRSMADSSSKQSFGPQVFTASRIRKYSMCLGLLLMDIVCISLAYSARGKEQFNKLVPYVSAAPILSFLLLRNATTSLRSHHSRILGWIGRHSLETFTLQFHIWLAADTKGILTTGILDRYIYESGEFVVLSIIFLWFCSYANTATNAVTLSIVEPEKLFAAPDLDLARQRCQEQKIANDRHHNSTLVNTQGPHKEQEVRQNSPRLPITEHALGGRSENIWLRMGLMMRLTLCMAVLWTLNMLDALTQAARG